MGLIKHLLFWPVTGPQFLIEFSLGKVQDTVREELVNDDAVKEDLLALQMRYELGELDDDQYAVEEAMLMQRLRDVRHWREEFGMGTSGGPVRVRAEPPPDSAPDFAENVVASPPGTDDTDEDDDTPRGGIAQPGGATVEFNLDWEE